MNVVYHTLKNNITIPFSDFNKGMTGKIFEEVRNTGAKIVMKNNVPECVLLSPREYMNLMEQLEQIEDVIKENQEISTFDQEYEALQDDSILSEAAIF